MNVKLLTLALLALGTRLIAVPNELMLIDTIDVVIYGKESDQLVTRSDISRKGLDGSERTIDDVVFERALYVQTQELKGADQEENAVKRFEALQRDNNMTREQFDAMLHAAGYTREEALEQFRIMLADNAIMQMKVGSKATATHKEVEEHYQQHPIYEPASYQVEHALVRYGADEPETHALEQELKQYGHTGKTKIAVDWSNAFWINAPDLAAEKKFISTLSVNQISQPVRAMGGFELFRLKQKRPERLKPLASRYHEIEQIISKPKRTRLMEAFKTEVLEKTPLVRLTPVAPNAAHRSAH